MWDWDEALFCLGLRGYNVVQHHPHPPGYPLFIALGHLVRPFTHSDFLALQIVVMASGAALLPLMFFFAHEARFPFASALGGALIFVFLPNVWIYCGSAMSDVPALALTLAACALLLGGCRSNRAYLAGAICLGLAAGIRPQALMAGIACGAIATLIRWRENRRVVAIGAIAGAIVVVACYGGAAIESESPAGYLAAVRSQSYYVSVVDSYRNPGRTPLPKLLAPFFVTPVKANAVEIVSILAAIGGVAAIALRRVGGLIAIATFGPLAIFSWLMLDISAISRYAIGYMPLHALLAADALTVIATFALRPQLAEKIAATACVAVAASLAVWTWPATRRVRSNDAPPMAAIRWVLHNAYPGAGTLFVHNGFGPFADYFLRPYQTFFFERVSEVPYGGYTEPAFVLIPEFSRAADAHVFARPHDRLWRIVRARYFEASVVPAWDLLRFGRGWHDEEGDGVNNWRWMTRSSETLLPPLGARGRLTVRMYAPLNALPVQPEIEVRLNGAVIDRFVVPRAEFQKSWIVDARGGAANELVLTTSAAAKNPGDPRELGLKLLAMTWQPSNR